MKMSFFSLALVLFGLSLQAKTIGTQYEYTCQNEDGSFELTVTKSGDHKAVKIDGEYIDAETIEIQPRLGNKEIQLYFLGAPGEDEQYNVCRLKSRN